ncbi:MAG: hypothetical protein QW228_03295 [Candidatus Aenigmatarchaeota archaeon]
MRREDKLDELVKITSDIKVTIAHIQSKLEALEEKIDKQNGKLWEHDKEIRQISETVAKISSRKEYVFWGVAFLLSLILAIASLILKITH